MRGNHTQYIDVVNALTPDYYSKVARGMWNLTSELPFTLPDGTTRVLPIGRRGDMFSVVPDTNYKEFQKSAWLHDDLRPDCTIARYYADFCFAYDMMYRISLIRQRLLDVGCPAAIVDKEVIRLTRVASLYVLGVSGNIGSIYIWMDKLSGWRKWFK